MRGHTNDDLVALNSDEGDWRSSDCTIEDILIEDLDGEERGYTGVRLLSRNAQVRNVTIRRVRAVPAPLAPASDGLEVVF